VSYTIFELYQDGIPKLLAGIDSRQAWEQKRQQIMQTWIYFIGGLPERVPLSYEVTGEEQEADHRRIHLIYETVYGDRVTAYLLVPAEHVPGKGADGRRPAVLAFHPTHESGKANVATPEGRENQRYGLELVSRGYVVLAPDALTAGERIYKGWDSFHNAPFYEEHPEWTSVGKNAIDHIHGIDLLCALKEVDPQRIGAIGHSFGGYNSYFLAGLDNRIKAIVNSCGFSPFTSDPRPTHWGVREWYTHLPKITECLGQHNVPFEFNEIAALAAPTPFFNYFAQGDLIFPHWQSIGDCMADLNELYTFLDSGDCFQSIMGVKDHNFPPEIRRIAYDFLDRWLMAT